MSRPEMPFSAVVVEQGIQTEALPSVTIRDNEAFVDMALPVRRLDNRELAVDLEPIAEVFGKMTELSFQKHGGADASPIKVHI